MPDEIVDCQTRDRLLSFAAKSSVAAGSTLGCGSIEATVDIFVHVNSNLTDRSKFG
jgi:hypothetical protein